MTDSTRQAAAATTTTVPKSFLIITNISKRTNVRMLLQVGVAFGCTKILVVGQKSFHFHWPMDDASADARAHNDNVDDDDDVDRQNDNHACTTDIPRHLLPVFASGIVTIERFEKWQNCVTYLQENSILLVGVEIHVDAKTIQEICHQLSSDSSSSGNNDGTRDVAFVMGNEGTGLQEKQMKSCDYYCRIPQYGSGTASLNVYVAASIVLYHFHQYQRRQRAEEATLE